MLLDDRIMIMIIIIIMFVIIIRIKNGGEDRRFRVFWFVVEGVWYEGYTTMTNNRGDCTGR